MSLKIQNAVVILITIVEQRPAPFGRRILGSFRFALLNYGTIYFAHWFCNATLSWGRMQWQKY